MLIASCVVLRFSAI